MKNVYITKTGHFLPNEPVSNDEMEKRLGMIDDQPSRARRIVLRNNGIKERYYAVDSHGNITHNNAQLTRETIKNLCDSDFSEKEIELLSCGTSTPDNLLPSHASMVHGLLDTQDSIELNTASGVCCSGMSALKYGFLSVKSDSTKNAICTGTERVSTWMQSRKFDKEVENLKSLEEQPIIGFKKDFLRWMLSDGGGAFLLEDKPRGENSLRIDWMQAYSFAHELEACMYAGGDKNEDGSLKPWSEYEPAEWLSESVFSLKQDVKILDKHVVPKAVSSMKDAFEKNNLNEEEIDYFLPHISSFYFEERLSNEMINQGISIPKSKWFTNLEKVGNVGSASIYLMINELKNSGKLKKGDKVVAMVPESGRFSYFHILFTVC
ncbi:beta-ketoacyl-ACP synthase III [Aquimarina sp. MMG015]|uniref:beta-ketoacyl-ACP synthase III n=1 Tax=Aquimarina TaxID=290174 RepID=UPI0004893AA8|nr:MULTISPECIES: beta-ketoacyl-ACP synthase III [Aquimarina]AXT55612.1 StlD/DarB family beta-ketosynthase [Aquimarina sp. AD1]MBQ4804386.1 beta-ketoacyl-ACP synthase III [Aquimarina sp. MMG015]RKN37444.1 StlD/DarB family beta-ketosynthase [Aquimarina sp. AD1]